MKNFKKVTAFLLALGMTAGSVMTGVPMNVSAQQVTGSAPFINSWLISGPFEEPVADLIYQEDEIQVDRPEDGNWASVAEASASSTWQTGQIDYPGQSPSPNFLPQLAIDGKTNTAWVAQTHNRETGGPEDWPVWDPQPTFYLDWKTPISVKRIELFGRGIPADEANLTCVLNNKKGNVLSEGDITKTGTDTTGYVELDKTVAGVSHAEIIIHYEGKPASIAGIGFTEVQVLDGLGESGEEVIDRPEDGNWARRAKAEANSTYSAGLAAAYAIDGDTSTQWSSRGGDGVWPRTLTLTWDSPIEVKRIEALSRPADPDADNVTSIKCELYDADNNKLDEITTTDPGAMTLGFAEFENAVEGVCKMLLILDGDRNGNIGLAEVYVYDNREDTTPGDETLVKVSPTLGQDFGTKDGEQKKWEYFDDRIYNRNYDDYQDLSGYYTTKQGIDTKNKYVYAHTYVYSEKKQKAQVRVGASGSYRVFFNDRGLTQPSEPKEVQKDMTVRNVTLKEGWNKLLIQIEHTYTEDVNSNGIPVAQDQNVSYLGFYGRITDGSGAEIEGLEYSVEGGKNDGLEIATQGLKQAGDLPDKTLPTGYKEWPYVWNKSTTNKAYGLSASAFRFQANGGEPGYKWTIVDGALPDNLELNEDGTIADGLDANGKPNLNSDKGIIPATCEEGDYKFTVQVQDKAGNTAQKEFTITVKERPNKWFEEGRVGALSHDIVIPTWFVDANYSADLWAERAKRQGHSLVSIEALQQNYYWPSKFADPAHIRNIYMAKDENGLIKDGLKQFEEAVKRYGMKFGLYYATEGGGLQHFSTDVFVQNVSDLIERYEPAYLYFDGPQAMRSANYDVMYSNVRNHSNDIIINSNAWGEEFGDPDLGTGEASHIYSNVRQNHFVKKVVFEPWKSILTKNNLPSAYAKRDDYVQVAKEMVMNAGRGYADNNDQMPICKRGPNWDSPEAIATTYPQAIQEYIDVRENVAAWFAPDGKPERHESTTGTTPYFLSGYGYEDDGKGNYDKFAFPNANIGPRWGYATSRDNNIYLHIMSGPDSKIGFDAIQNNTLEIGPISNKVESVSWLNEDQAVEGFTQNGDRLTIDLTGVEEDPVDTIIKITTDSKERRYQLGKLYLEGETTESGELRIKAEGQMGYQAQQDDEELTVFPALKAKLSNVVYESANTEVVTVDNNGMVTPVSDGTTVIKVTGTYEENSASSEITISVKDGTAYVDDEITSVVLHVEDREEYGEFLCYDSYDVSVEGRSTKGGATGLNDAEIRWHAGTVDLDGGDQYVPVNITENDILRVVNGRVIPKVVTEKTRAVLWADVIKDGKTYTTNRMFMDLRPEAELAKESVITASENEDMVKNVTDGKAVTGTLFDSSKWTAKGKSWLAFELPEKVDVSEIDLTFNTKDQNYINTPQTIEIQTSEDGETWTTKDTVSGPTGGAYFGFYTPYEVNLNTKYIRLQFEGRNGGASDIMEVSILGGDVSNTLTEIQVEPKLSEEQNTVSVDVKGFDHTGKDVDLDGAQITLISDNTNVAIVNEDNTISAVNTGRTSIRVQVLKGHGYVEKSVYVTVDENGKFQLLPYLDEVNLVLKTDDIRFGKPAVVIPELKLNNGESIPATGAEITYVIGDSRLQQVEGTNTIVLKEEVQLGFKTEVKAVVTYDGCTVESKPITLCVTGKNLAASADRVTTSSVYGGDRYPGENALDGDKTTHWASSGPDKSPWIQLDFDSEIEIGSLNIVDRGHDVNEIKEGVLEFFDADGNVIHTQKVTGILWQNCPDNIVTLETPIKAYSVKFTIDPEVKYYQNGSARGLVEFQIFAPEKEIEKSVAEVFGVDVITEQDVIPTLPGENITVVYNTGETEKVSVTWNEITKEDVAEVGSFVVEGVINGTDLKVSTTVTVVEKKETAEPANKTLLQKSYDYALTLSTDGVTDSAKAFFEKALANAKAVLDKEAATQDEVNTAWDNLLEGIWGLGIVKGDTTMLEMLIGRADAMITEKDRYVETNWQQLVDALAAAKEVANNGDALEEDIQPAADALLNAILAQRYKADKSNLEELLKKVEGLNLNGYTAESVQAFKTVLARAMAVMADDTLSVDNQEKVDKAAKELQTAIDGLKLASNDGDNNNGTGSENDNNDNGTSDGGNNQASGADGNKTTDTAKDAPKTGDTMNVAVWLVLMAAVVVATEESVRRRRRS